jgi:hypothetical protein
MKIIKNLEIIIKEIFTISLLMWITWGLWNWLMPTLFGLKTITVYQALGINILSNILFKPYNLIHNKEDKLTSNKEDELTHNKEDK